MLNLKKAGHDSSSQASTARKFVEAPIMDERKMHNLHASPRFEVEVETTTKGDLTGRTLGGDSKTPPKDMTKKSSGMSDSKRMALSRKKTFR